MQHSLSDVFQLKLFTYNYTYKVVLVEEKNIIN